MKAVSRQTKIGVVLAAAAAVLLAFAACAGGSSSSEPSKGLSLVPSGPPPGKVQLLVTKVDEGTVAMRSPTFR